MSYYDSDNKGQIERYSYSFEPAGGYPPPKKRRDAGKAVIAIVCAMLLALGGGIAGSLITYANLQNNPDTPAAGNELNAPFDPTPAAPGAMTPIASVNPGGGPLALTELFEGANPAVVAISTQMTGRNIFGQIVNQPASGSGFIISEDGYVATNNHVISDANEIKVVTHDGKEYPATLVGSDASTDVAVLKIEADGLSHLTFGDSDALKVGQQVAAIGNPLGELANSFAVGYISALDRELNIDGIPRHMLQTDASINSGNSGGPLLDLAGRVIGVVTAKSVGQNVEGLGFAIPSNRVSGIVRQLIENGYVSGRAAMGVELSTRSNYSRTYVVVETVSPGSAAEKAGVQIGDIILFANDIYISDVSELKAVLAGLAPGDKLVIDVQRDNVRKTLTLTLDEYKPSISTESTEPDEPQTSEERTLDPRTWRLPWDVFQDDDEFASPAA